MSSSQAVIDHIRRAFSGVTRPPPSDFLHCDACEIWLERFLDSPDQNWEELSSEDIAYEYNAPTAVTPAGFRYLLPAFMVWHIRNPDSDANTSEHLLYQLTLSAEHPDEMLPRFEALSVDQADAVRAFLRHVKEQHPDKLSRRDAEIALTSYWERADA